MHFARLVLTAIFAPTILVAAGVCACCSPYWPNLAAGAAAGIC